MKSNVDYMKKIVKEMKSKVNLSIVSTDYAKGYCYALLDYLLILRILKYDKKIKSILS